jgi:hypothetical protein
LKAIQGAAGHRGGTAGREEMGESHVCGLGGDSASAGDSLGIATVAFENKMLIQRYTHRRMYIHRGNH